MERTKSIAASAFISRLDLNAITTDSVPYTYWCRVAYSRLERLNLKPQRHSFFELHLCLNGSCDLMVHEQRLTVSKGEFILIPPGTSHTILGTTYDFEKLIWGFSPTDKSEADMLTKAMDTVTVMRDIPDEWYHSVDRMIHEGTLNSECSVHIIRGELQYLYTGLVRRFLPNRRHLEAVRKVGVRAEAVRKFIKDNLSLPLSVSDIAAQFFLSERQLERICHAEYKMTVGKLINAQKVESIRELLANTNLSLSEIAVRTGFSDRYSMSRFFTREEGMPPARYRASLVE